MARKKAPVELTGGSGFRFEDQVAARLLLDILAGQFSLGLTFGRPTRLHWQVRDAGWLFDDIVIEFEMDHAERAAALSIKSDRRITTNGFPEDFTADAWSQVLGLDGCRPLRIGTDAIVLVVGQLANSVDIAWAKLLRESLVTTPDRMLSRFASTGATGAQSSARERALFESLRCPQSLRGMAETDDQATIGLVRSLRVLHFDFGATPSRDEGRAVLDAQAVLRSGRPEQAVGLWKLLLEVASSMRVHGGTMDGPGLVERLRGHFELHEHPDYRQDWATLEQRTRDDLDDVRSQIDGIAPLARDGDVQRLLKSVEKHSACLLVGDSGVGKSALAKSFSNHFDRIVWLRAETLPDDRSQLRARLGLHHSFDEVLSSARERVLVVIDAAERLSPRATKVLARTLRDIHQRADIASLLTAQGESASNLVNWLRDGGLSEVEVVALQHPSEDSIRALLADFSGLKWTLLRPEVRPALRNLKVLEWIVQAVQRGEVLDESAILNVSGLIELLWHRWVGADSGDLGRSEALLRLGAAEGEVLVRGVARLALGVEPTAISELVRSGLLRIRHERISFTHDLLGDWARLRVLIGEVPDDVGKLRLRAEKPRWHRAIRLYGQWLVDHGAGDPTAWFDLLRAVDDGTAPGTVARDLLLEAPFLASNAEAVLEAVWPKLIVDDASLLETMLDRFLYVGTVPDPAMAEHFRGRDEASMAAHLFRVPLSTYWGAMLRALSRHAGDVSRFVPDVGARIAILWLRCTLPAVQQGRRIAWRSEAASLAIRIAEDFRASIEEHDFHPSEENKPLFEALLYSAPEDPQRVGALCLELCYRRPLAEAVEVRRARGTAERAAQRQAGAVSERYAYLTTSVLPRGDLRAPWTDGPSRRVNDAFAEACLDAGAFAALVHADARVSREVLLAVCIEEPKHDDPHGYSLRHDDLGLRHWPGGFPALHFRGPFLRFFHESPTEALTFVLRLVNFATERWVDGFVRYARRDGSADAVPGVEVAITGESMRWNGDDAVYQWRSTSDLGNGAVPCALMALEFWIYQRIDAGDDVSPMLDRIVAEGRSLAFAGLLLDVGKRRPDLLASIMRPLMTVWELYVLDSQLVTARSWQPELIHWQREPVAQLAIEWYGLEHRARRLWDVVAELAITRTDLQEFFRATREAWSCLLDNDRPDVLRLLIESLNPASYVAAKLPDGTPVLVPQWPEHISKRHAEERLAIESHVEETTLPWQCRKWLDGEEPFVAEEAPRLWEVAQRVAKEINRRGVRSEPEFNDPRSVVYGVIATLVALCPDWLAQESSRATSCRDLLGQALSAPLPSRAWGETSPTMERGFDAFAAETGTVLLARDRADLLGRKLASWGATSVRPNVVGRVMARAFLEREHLGEDFQRLQALVVGWSGLSGTIRFAKYARQDDAELQERRQLLAAAFIDGSLRAARTSLASVDSKAAAEQERIAASTQRGLMSLNPRPPRSSIALDERILKSGFSWLDLSVGKADEHEAWVAFLEEALNLVLAALTKDDDNAKRSYRRSAIPKDMDTWVLEYVARTVPRLDDVRGARLWRPILSMGAREYHWVETFLTHWNASGSAAAPSVRRFGEVWRSMILCALDHEAWHPRYGARDYDLARIVRVLLGFGWKVDKTSNDAQSKYAAEIATAVPLFARAAQRWFTMPYVAATFVSLATQNAGRILLIPGMAWLEGAVSAYDEEDWRETSLTDAIVQFLRTAWERERRLVVSDPTHRKRFETLLSILAARGSHAAQSLRDELVDSIHDG